MKSCTAICNYCNHTWRIWIYSKMSQPKCTACNDTDLKLVENKDVFGYESDAPKPDAYIKNNKS